ncbi:hypothetical protein ACH5RR_020691 [Cinchona calisaya]|uniref:Alpha-1,4 glucan phosphorylase n=1 Tax=Cinchona calisaya TaxID=153742 RepID=A0ABD2ZJ11_9GENT
METKAKLNGFATANSGIPDKFPAVAQPLADEATEIASNINSHAQYTPHFSPFKFEPVQAYYATADSVRDRARACAVNVSQGSTNLILLLLLFVGRALTNAIGNLNIQDAYSDALKKLGHELEEIVEQEKDAARGNGGLGRLASCFLDSMATLNLPAWGYGLRYRYGHFKQRIGKAGQEEIAEDWPEKFSPWEIVRHDVVFPVRFFGHVEILPPGSRKWVGGGVIQAVAYDESAAQLHSRAQQICAVLYPGDATENGKLLRLKQQFFLCSASLQETRQNFVIFICKGDDILNIMLLERKEGKGVLEWSKFPTKVAVQLNDTHPTLAIPELMHLLRMG